MKTSKQINKSLLNMITPFGAFFKRNKVYWGENIVKVYGIVRYGATLPVAWASKISNLANVILYQHIEPTDNTELIKKFSQSATKYRLEAEAAREPLEQYRAERKAEDSENLMKYLNDGNGTVWFISNFIMAFGRSNDQLNNICKRLESTISALGCRLRLFANQQKEAFKATSPYNVPDEILLQQTRRNVPMPTFVGGFPFASNGFIDEKGYILGFDRQNGLIAVDLWKREEDRTNSNIVVTGKAGQGKSALVKLLMIKELMKGSVILALDPEREYSELAVSLKGDIIYAGGGKYKINPLQVKTVPIDDENEEGVKLFNVESMPPLALHLKSLEIFFKLYAPEITSVQLSLLEQLVIKLYKNFNMDWDTDFSQFKNTDYPIFSDLYNLLIEQEEKGSLNKSFIEEMKFIKLMLHKLAHGSDQFLWNGPTTIESNSKVIVMDTFDLQEQSENVKRAQYFIMLTWAWERMSRNREEKVMLFADEAYLMIDPNVPQSLCFLRNVSKRARKYEAGLCVISHSIIDFLAESVKMYGQALLDIATYKFMFGTEGQNLKDLTYLYNLTEAEQEFLRGQQKGNALFVAGSRRFITRVKISDANLARMGKGGGK